MARFLHHAGFTPPEHPPEPHAVCQKQLKRLRAVKICRLYHLAAPLLGNRLRRTQQLRPDPHMLQNASPVLRGGQRAKRKIIPKHNALPPQPIVCEDAAF